MIRSFFTCLAFGLILNAPVFAQTQGCTNILACNFDFLATQDDGSCNFCCEGNVDMSGIGPTFCGCTDPLACNWDPFANLDDASCQYCCPLSNDTIQVFSLGGSQTSNDCGCTNPNACNYDPDASIDDGSCHFLCQYCKEGTIWDDGVQGCIVAKPSDSNFDGCVQLNDLLDLLSAFGDCGDEESVWQCGEPLGYQGYDYATVQIGEQCWFAENLRAENYNNGDEILSSLSDGTWFSTTLGATAVYGEGTSDCSASSPDGDACNEVWSLSAYGRYYNWFATIDERGLCPTGWHVPTDAEWTMLTEQLGGLSVAGAKMKTIYGWDNGGNGSNSSGLSCLPSGYRDIQGFYGSAGIDGTWWTSTSDGSNAWSRYLNLNVDDVFRSSTQTRYAVSVRCIKNAE